MSGPLILSAFTGATESVKYLLERHVKPDLSNAEGYRPLMMASLLGRLDIMQLLVSAGADINAASKTQETAVTEACSGGRLDAVRWLVEHGADLSIAGEQGMSALATSAMSKNPALLAYVIEQLKKRHAAPWHCYQALDYAAAAAPRATLAEIYQTCPEPDTFAIAGPSALFMAAVAGMTENLEWLLDAGLDPNAVLAEGSDESPWSMKYEATGDNAPASITRMTVLIAAATSGKLPTVEALLHRGASIAGRTREGLTALMAACASGHVDIVKRLIEAGADVNDQTLTDKFTALMYAARRGATDIVNVLLAAGAAPSPENDQGLTALDLARSENRTDVMKILDPITSQP